VTRAEVAARLERGGFDAILVRACEIYRSDDIGGQAIGELEAGRSVAVLAFEQPWAGQPELSGRILCGAAVEAEDVDAGCDFEPDAQAEMEVYLLVDPEGLVSEKGVEP
jgi:hypothetical protein